MTQRLVKTALGITVAGALAAACGGGGYGGGGGGGGGGGVYGGGGGGSSPSPTARGGAGASVGTADSKFGAIVVDGSGRSLYLFEADKGDSSTCYGECAGTWPPYLAKGKPQAGDGVDGSKLKTTTRDDGKTQVTYGGHPLYYFDKDSKRGDVNGQEVVGYGAEWYLVTPNGEKAQG